MHCRFGECVWETEQIPSSAWLSLNIVNDEELLKPNWFYLHQRLLRHGHQSADENDTFTSITGGREAYSFWGIRKFVRLSGTLRSEGSHVLYTYSCNLLQFNAPWSTQTHHQWDQLFIITAPMAKKAKPDFYLSSEALHKCTGFKKPIE